MLRAMIVLVAQALDGGRSMHQQTTCGVAVMQDQIPVLQCTET